MPSISYDNLACWSNYHLTLSQRYTSQPIPHLIVKSLGRFHASEITAADGITRFVATGRTLFSHLEKFEAMLKEPPKGPTGAEPRTAEDLNDPEFMKNYRIAETPIVGLVGRGWSFSELIGTEFSQLLCDGLSGTGVLDPQYLDPEARLDAGMVAMASGGTRLRELVNWGQLQPRKLTVETSGTHLGLTVAGGIATASHGSRIGFGGLQDCVLGMHLVVAPGQHVWIEPEDKPVLNDAGLAALSIDGVAPILVRDNEHFQNALVHLGAMGIVNGVAVKMTPDVLHAPLRIAQAIDADWLTLLDDGKFHEIAQWAGCDSKPYFYELTLDPHGPFTSPALHSFLFRTKRKTMSGTANACHVGDAITSLTALTPSATAMGSTDLIKRALQAVFKNNTTSAFAHYGSLACFGPPKGPFDPDSQAVPALNWASLHPDEITGDMAGALYNASFAIPSQATSRAVAAICEAVAHLPPSFVFTLRFVSQPAGTLAFTRFVENTVIEIDGLSPLICQLLAAEAAASSNPIKQALAPAYLQLANTLPAGAKAVREALEAHSIQYSMHWGKLGDLDRAKVQADFGSANGSGLSSIERWRATRDHLIPEEWRSRFVNKQLLKWGMLPMP
ncbi:MAG: FAD-binding protein [Sphingomonadaceae bacterium]|nr:FAD-binding protein [Sphingomonadaceae bacterium]